MVLDGNSLQEYSVNAGVPQGSILISTLFLLYINHLADNIICYIVDYTTIKFKCDQTSDLWQKLEMAAELKFDLKDIFESGSKWLVGFNIAKT